MVRDHATNRTPMTSRVFRHRPAPSWRACVIVDMRGSAIVVSSGGNAEAGRDGARGSPGAKLVRVIGRVGGAAAGAEKPERGSGSVIVNIRSRLRDERRASGARPNKRAEIRRKAETKSELRTKEKSHGTKGGKPVPVATKRADSDFDCRTSFRPSDWPRISAPSALQVQTISRA